MSFQYTAPFATAALEGTNIVVRSQADASILATFGKSQKAQKQAEKFAREYNPTPDTTASPEAPTEETKMTDSENTPADTPIEAAPAPDATPEQEQAAKDANDQEMAKEDGEAPAPARTPEQEAAYQRRKEGAAKRLAGEYDPTKTHANLLSERKMAVLFADDVEAQAESGEPLDFSEAYVGGAVQHRRVPTGEKWQFEHGVTVHFADDSEGTPAINSAFTSGTWRGVKTTSLWIEVRRLDLPTHITKGLKKDDEPTAIFHILVPNDKADVLDGAHVYIRPDTAEEIAAAAAAPKAEKAPKAPKAAKADEAPAQTETPTADTPAEQVAPAARKGKKRPAPEATEAQA